MGMALDITPGTGFLRAGVKGEFALADANSCFLQLLRAIASHRARKVLVDCCAVGGLITTLDRWHHATFAVEELFRAFSFGVWPGTPFGYVARPPVFDRFGETVARNRGANVRLFGGTQAALQWLGVGHP